MQFLFMILFGVVVIFVIYVSYKAYIFERDAKNISIGAASVEKMGGVENDIRSGELASNEKKSKGDRKEKHYDDEEEII